MSLNKTVVLLLIFLSLTSLSTFSFQLANASSIADDWPMLMHDPARTGYTNSPGPASGSVLWSFNKTGTVSSSPAVVDGSVYVTSSYGNVYRLNATTGAQIWLNFKIPGGISSSPTVVNKRLYVGASDGRVYCLDAESGGQIWNYSTGLYVDSSPTVSNGRVYVGSADGNLYCLDAESGGKLWNYTTSPYDFSSNIGPYASGFSSPAVVDDRVYVGGTSFYSLNAISGSLIWAVPIFVRLTPAVSHGHVYFTDDSGTTYCLDASNGNQVWNYTVRSTQFASGASSPAIANGYLFLGGDGVTCLNASIGKKVWAEMQGLVDIYPFSTPAVAQDRVYIWTTQDRYVYCLDVNNGSVIWRGDFVGSNGFAGNPPAISNGVLYVANYEVKAFGVPNSAPSPSLSESTSPAISSPSGSSGFPISAFQIIVVATVVAIVLVVTAFLVYMNKRKQIPPNSPIIEKLKKRFFLVTTALLIAIVAIAFLSAFYSPNNPPTQGPSPSPSATPPGSFLTTAPSLPDPLWQHDIGHQVSGSAYDNGKAFAVDNFGGIFAYDAQTGQLLWKNSTGPYGTSMQVYQGSLYVSGDPATVTKFNETTGQKEARFYAPTAPGFGARAAASFYFEDGRIIVNSYGTAVFNATSGELFWIPSNPGGNSTMIYGNASETASKTNYVYVAYNSVLDLDNATELWRIKGGYTQPAFVTDGAVVLPNYNPNGQTDYITGNATRPARSASWQASLSGGW